MEPKVVIIGAVAAGPKTACRIKRLNNKARVTMLDRDDIISYGGCGIPYYVSGDVADLSDLRKTAFHMVRDAGFFQAAKGVQVLTRTEALAIDRAAKKVRVKDLGSGQESDLEYDKLVIATGAKNFIPPIPGVEAQGVMPVGNLHQAEKVKNLVAQGQVESAVIIGAGATGIELAEALNDLWGIEVHLVEVAPQVVPGLLDPDMAAMLANRLKEQEDFHLHLSAKVGGVLAGDDGRVRAVQVDGQEVAAQLVIMATGVRPNGELAAAAGLKVTERGAILVDEHLCTSDPDIYAGGDCVAVKNRLTGDMVNIAAGSLANRMGRVIGSNVCGQDAVFPGVVGSWCMKVFGLSVARTGLGAEQAKDRGQEVVAPLVVQSDRAHFHPDQKLMYLKLVAEKGTRRVLGVMAAGENGDAVVGRVNAAAGLIAMGALVEDFSNLELAYAPPLGAAMDVLNTAANAADNMLADRLHPIGPQEFSAKLAQCRLDGSQDGPLFIDVRRLPDVKPFLDCLGPYWVHLPQEELAQRLSEVPKDREVVLVCNTGGRSYEAHCLLEQEGFENTVNLSGGVASVRLSGDEIITPGQKE